LEADLRRPFLGQQLQLKASPGLAECLEQGFDPLSAIRRIEPLRFYLLPAGKPVANPLALLQSQRFSKLIQDLADYFHWILIDSPPVSPVADTLALKAHIDGTLLVVRARVTPRDAMEEAVKHFEPGQVIGLILNGADGLDRSYSQYYRHEPRDNSQSGTKQRK